MARFETVQTIIDDVAVELGLTTAVDADVFASTDANILQLLRLLKSVGRRLVMENDWLQLRRERQLFQSGTGTYSLPAGFLSLVSGSIWNRTQNRPLTPVSPERWQQLKASNVSSALYVVFRPRETTLELYPDSNTGDSIYYEYMTSYWVETTGAGQAVADEATDATDVVKIEWVLITAALKLAFKEAKGFDTTAALADYQTAFNLVRSANAVTGPTLSLNSGGSGLAFPNVPETGFGG